MTPLSNKHKVEVHMQAHFSYHSLCMMVAFEVLTKSLSIQHLVVHDC